MPDFDAHEQQRRRSACASAQSDQRLCYTPLVSTLGNPGIHNISKVQLVPVAELAGFNLTCT